MSILDLWQPILLGTFIAWIVSAILHMVVKHHNSDYQKLSNEDEVMAAIRNGSPPLGLHSMPYCVDMKEMQDPAMQKKYADGPVVLLTILPNGMPPMGKLIGQQIVYFLIGGCFLAYCAILALNPGAEYMTVFRFVGAVGFLAFGWGVVPFSIWFGNKWSMTAKYLLDALIYGLVFAGAFAWLWPAA